MTTGNKTMNHDEMLRRLRSDVAAAKAELPDCTCEPSWPRLTCLAYCERWKATGARNAARARLAALPGPELVEALVKFQRMWHEAHDEHWHAATADECAYGECGLAHAVLDRCATALEVSTHEDVVGLRITDE